MGPVRGTCRGLGSELAGKERLLRLQSPAGGSRAWALRPLRAPQRPELPRRRALRASSAWKDQELEPWTPEYVSARRGRSPARLDGEGRRPPSWSAAAGRAPGVPGASPSLPRERRAVQWLVAVFLFRVLPNGTERLWEDWL